MARAARPLTVSLNFDVQSVAPVRIANVPHNFVSPNDEVKLIPAQGDTFTLSVTRGELATLYPGFVYIEAEKIWQVESLTFLNRSWYSEIKHADYSSNVYLYAILIPLPLLVSAGGEPNDDPDATGGYTARGQAGLVSPAAEPAKRKSAGARKAAAK